MGLGAEDNMGMGLGAEDNMGLEQRTTWEWDWEQRTTWDWSRGQHGNGTGSRGQHGNGTGSRGQHGTGSRGQQGQPQSAAHSSLSHPPPTYTTLALRSDLPRVYVCVVLGCVVLCCVVLCVCERVSETKDRCGGGVRDVTDRLTVRQEHKHYHRQTETKRATNHERKGRQNST